eukprot:Phypoly_transcript_08253.p1 GENE.Phypoly_transcript_08253~~Phypoly_transcript_08253.p1  ORF type:complete len:294 (+),score=14.01 Phypoly_transcript_08253:633-1514(+)
MHINQNTLIFVLLVVCCSLSLIASVLLALVLCVLKRGTKLYYRLALAIGIGLSLSASAGILSAVDMRTHILNGELTERWRLKTAVVTMRQFDFMVIWYLAAMYANFVRRSFGKGEFHARKREAAIHILFWLGNIAAAGFLAWQVEGVHQDILDYVFLGVGALPFLFMIPATAYIVRKNNETLSKNTPLVTTRTKKRLMDFLVRIVAMLAFTGVLFAKWVAFTYIYVNLMDKYELPSKISPLAWYTVPFGFLDGFLLSVLLVSTPELRGLYRTRVNPFYKKLEDATELPVSQEE